MSTRAPRRLAPVLLASAAAVALATGLGVATATAAAAGAGSGPPVRARAAARRAPARAVRNHPCGRSVAHPRYRHVLWVVMENEPYASVVGSPSAPFATRLARACGIADHYVAVTHPSLPNYLALAAGTTFGIADDAYPSSHALRAASIFSQLASHHLRWASYEESMTRPCEQVSAGLYAVKHNPAAYFVPLRAQCDRFDVPMGTLRSGALVRALRSKAFPSFALVTPNVCDDGHSCALSTADAWLRRFVDAVTASPAYRRGHLVVFVTWDEGSGADQRVPLLVVAPSVPSGTVAHGAFSHYGLLRTTEELLGLPGLGAAAHAASMVHAFRL